MMLFCIIFFLSYCISNAVPLFDQYPALDEKLPYIRLCDLPTPVQRTQQLEALLNADELYIKRDDMSGMQMPHGRLYGGNKPRKLEFLLAEALEKNARAVITFGCVGSNHALATAQYASYLGLPCTLMLKHQPNSAVVKTNLINDYALGATLRFFANNQERMQATKTLLSENPDHYFIPTGGSTALGALGFVNAGLELAQQIKEGILKKPDYIYVAMGSCGTTAGLLVGLKLAGLSSKIIAVCVEPEEYEGEFLQTIKNLHENICVLLHSIDPEINILPFDENDLQLHKEFVGTGYGVFMPSVGQAIEKITAMAPIALEATYSGKAVAAILHDGQRGLLQDKTVLYWHTFCAAPAYDQSIDYQELPLAFHSYFQAQTEREEINISLHSV